MSLDHVSQPLFPVPWMVQAAKGVAVWQSGRGPGDEASTVTNIDAIHEGDRDELPKGGGEWRGKGGDMAKEAESEDGGLRAIGGGWKGEGAGLGLLEGDGVYGEKPGEAGQEIGKVGRTEENEQHGGVRAVGKEFCMYVVCWVSCQLFGRYVTLPDGLHVSLSRGVEVPLSPGKAVVVYLLRLLVCTVQLLRNDNQPSQQKLCVRRIESCEVR